MNINSQPPHESRQVKVARMAHRLASQRLPRYSHPKSPRRFTQPQLVACALLMFYLDLSDRDLEAWLPATDKVCQVLELKHIPDYSTLSRTFKKLRQSDLSALRDELLRQIGAEEEAVAGDSTSFRLCQASACYQTRRGQQLRDRVKGAYAVDTQSRLIVGWMSGAGSLPDFGFLRPLKRQVAAFGRKCDGRRNWLFLADAGFEAKGIPG